MLANGCSPFWALHLSFRHPLNTNRSVSNVSQTCPSSNKTASLRLRHLTHFCSWGLLVFLVPKPCKTAKFFNQLNVFPMSPVFVTAPFLVQKALKTANSEKCVFSCPASKVVPGPPNSLVFLRKPAPGAPKSVFWPEKPANSSPLSSSPLCHRSLFGRKSAQNRAQFSPQGFSRPGSPPRTWLGLHVTRQPAELVTADVTGLDSVEAKQYKRPDMNKDLRLGFEQRTNLTGTVGDGTAMVTLDYSHLTSVLWGVCKGFRLDMAGPAGAEE